MFMAEHGSNSPKVVFVTAHALSSYRDECLDAGATQFLTKPCSLKSVDECFLKLFADPARRRDSISSMVMHGFV